MYQYLMDEDADSEDKHTIYNHIYFVRSNPCEDIQSHVEARCIVACTRKAYRFVFLKCPWSLELEKYYLVSANRNSMYVMDGFTSFSSCFINVNFNCRLFIILCVRNKDCFVYKIHINLHFQTKSAWYVLYD